MWARNNFDFDEYLKHEESISKISADSVLRIVLVYLFHPEHISSLPEALPFFSGFFEILHCDFNQVMAIIWLILVPVTVIKISGFLYVFNVQLRFFSYLIINVLVHGTFLAKIYVL